MRRIAAALARATGGGDGGDKDCRDFASQAEAQAWFEAHGGSAANNVAGLDRNRNGIACEAYPYGRAGRAGRARRWAGAGVPWLAGVLAGLGLGAVRPRRHA